MRVQVPTERHIFGRIYGPNVIKLLGAYLGP